MTKDDIISLCLSLPDTDADYPFAEAHCVLRITRVKSGLRLYLNGAADWGLI